METNENLELYAKTKFDNLRKTLPKDLSKKEDEIGKRIEYSKLNHQGNLRELYSFMDVFFTFVSKFTPCKKGCSYCCHYEVAISEAEILYIEKNTKHKRMKKYGPKALFHGKPCPFLKNGNCSIYNQRPFVCRRHVVFRKTNFSCNPNLSLSYESVLLQPTSIDKAYTHILQAEGETNIYDIRQIFKEQ
jgi:Fe-S-cluster containining protein